MIQEDKNLLLQDLCGRLPYGVKVQSYSYEDDVETVETLYEINSDRYTSTLECDTLKNIHKPYLFPLSSMTDKQIEELYSLFDLQYPSIGEDYIKINEVTGITFFLCNGFDVETHLDKLLNWLNKNHFDWRGLIPMGLANDATGLNIY